MKKFYVVHGDERSPLVGGWVEVAAPDKESALKIYQLYFPNGYYNSRARVMTAREMWEHAPYDMQGAHCCLKARIQFHDAAMLREMRAHHGLPRPEEDDKE